MNFGGKKKILDQTTGYTFKKEIKNVTSPLLIYNQAPDGKIDFDEFATLALERFSVLQIVENVGTRHMKGVADYISKLDTEFRKIGFLKSILCNPKDGVDEGELTKDIISHFILRLAFCGTEEQKRWFMQQEVDLFRYKLQKVSTEPYIIQRFLQDNNLEYLPINESEKQSIHESLIEMGYSSTQIQSQDFYKVSFLEVLELVKSRRVFVKNGYAYVTIQDFGSVLLHVFRTHLSKSLSVLSKFSKEFEDDPRMSELFRILRERDTSDNFANTESKEHITAESLDSLSLKSMPICMRHLHESLKSYHHLKHYGRLQYILFLKGVGLPLDESLKFWRSEFSKGTIPADKFDKEYAYNIRHSYGQEGKRTSYAPYSCLKVITSHMPGANDYHGCPFKHFERNFLHQKLRQYGRTEEETKEIMEHTDNNNYQIGCQRYFELSHKTDEIVPINHPNQYFEASQRILGVTRKNANPRGPNIKIEHIKIEATH